MNGRSFKSFRRALGAVLSRGFVNQGRGGQKKQRKVSILEFDLLIILFGEFIALLNTFEILYQFVRSEQPLMTKNQLFKFIIYV